MKKLLTLLLIVFLLVGCHSKEEVYVRDTSPGDFIQITLEEMGEKMENGDEFVVAFTQEYCGYCAEFKAIYDEYKKDHHLDIYEVNLTAEVASENENANYIHKYFPSFYNTPGIYYAKDGEMVSSLTDGISEMNEELIEEWVVKNKLDNKK